MIAIRLRISATVSLILILLLTGPTKGQFSETYEPPGYLLQWGSYGTGDGQFVSPKGVAADAMGNVYVADTDNDRIQKFDSDGNFVTNWGSSGTGDTQFDSPSGVAVDSLGNVYVADTGNSCIKKFDSTGDSLGSWGAGCGGVGTADGQFHSPSGIATDTSGHVYVADTLNHRIQKFDSAGVFLDKWGSNGSFDGQFSSPSGVAADAFGNVYVADTGNDRIQRFDSDGTYFTQWGNYGAGDGQFSAPFGVTADAFGNVYVADTDNGRIQKFDSLGNYVTEWIGSSGKFVAPSGVAADGLGHLYVVDTDSPRIVKFSSVLWFDLASYDSYLSVATLHETTAVRTLFSLENNGAPRFAFKNTNSDIEWSFQQSGPGNFLISKGGTGGPEMQVYGTGMVRMGPGGANNFTLSPTGNLTIAGSLTANGSTFPDYVFEPDYDLMPLSDLRSFIWQEKRLPEIPSAEEVKRQGGHNMTELQIKLLEKIEELTLYTLEQDRQLLRKKVRIERLEAKVSAMNQLEVRLAGIERTLNER